jgi:hypothetical protein
MRGRPRLAAVAVGIFLIGSAGGWLVGLGLDRQVPEPPVPAEQVQKRGNTDPRLSKTDARSNTARQAPAKARPEAAASGGETRVPTPTRRPSRFERFAAQVPSVPDETPRIAIVIDDLGLSRDRTRKAIALPAPLTLAFLSYGRHLPELAVEARRAGHELLVHVPMQPKDTTWDAGANVLRADISDAERQRRIDWALSRFEGYVGINNHMGSAFTEDRDGMRAVMATLASNGLMFLDSRTTPESVAPETAKAFGVPFAGRDVFLDNEKSPAAIRQGLAQAVEIAQETGKVIAIGHPYPSTLAVLADWLPEARAKGVAVVPLSSMTAHPETSAPQTAARPDPQTRPDTQTREADATRRSNPL